jgi:predicted nucleic acid-binding Zn ribbon protein
MPKQRPQTPTRVGEVLERYLARAGLAGRLAQAEVVREWSRLVGPQIAAVTSPERVGPEGTLYVRVATSAWMTELQLMAPQIMARVNAERGRAGRVKGIRWLLATDRS